MSTADRIHLVEFSARVWPRYFASPNSAACTYASRARIKITGGITYKVKARLRRIGAGGTSTVSVYFYDVANATVGSAVVVASAVTPGTSWTDYSTTIAPAAVPVGAVTMLLHFVLNSGGGAQRHDAAQMVIEDNAVADVALSTDPNLRDLSHWTLVTGAAATLGTEVDATPQTLPVRYATAPYVTASGDTPALTPYEARVLQPGTVRSEVPASLGGSIISNYGEITLSNADGALCDLAYAGLSGVTVTVLSGSQSAARSTFSEAFVAAIEQATTDTRTVKLRLRGPDAALDRPVLLNRYAGTNALPAGLEGATDLEGQFKPRLFGKARNFAPPCVNTSRLIYQVHDAAADSTGIAVDAVRVRGLALSAGADYTDQTDMETTAPSAGQYRVWPDGGYIRLGTAPTGRVTCDATHQVSPAPIVGAIVDALATEAGVGTVRSGTDAVAGYAYCGLWVNDGASYAHVIQRLCASNFCWVGFAAWDGLPGGVFEFGIQQWPYTVYDWSDVDESMVLSIKGMGAPIVGLGVPIWMVDVGFAALTETTEVDLDSSVTQAERARLSTPYKRAQSSNAAVLTMHPDAGTLVLDTDLDDDATGAQTMAVAVVQTIYRARPCFEIVLALRACESMTIKPRLGGLIHLQQSALGAAWQRVLGINGSGVDYVECLILAIEINVAKQTLRLTALGTFY